MSKKTRETEEQLTAALAQGDPRPAEELVSLRDPGDDNHFPPATQPDYQRPADWRSRWLPSQQSTPDQWPTNLDLRTVEGRMALVNAGNPADIVLPESGEMELLISRYIIYPDQAVSQDTGELVDVCRAVFITEDGRTFKSTSEYAARKLGQCFQLFSKDEWAKGLRIHVRNRKSRNPKMGMYHDVRVVGIGPA